MTSLQAKVAKAKKAKTADGEKTPARRAAPAGGVLCYICLCVKRLEVPCALAWLV
jgi:hypothetical protein